MEHIKLLNLNVIFARLLLLTVLTLPCALLSNTLGIGVSSFVSAPATDEVTSCCASKPSTTNTTFATITYELYGRKGTLIPIPFTMVIKDALLAMAMEASSHCDVNNVNNMRSYTGPQLMKDSMLFNDFDQIFHSSRFIALPLSMPYYNISRKCPIIFSLIDGPPAASVVVDDGIVNDEYKDITLERDKLDDGIIQVLGGDILRDALIEGPVPINLPADNGQDPLRDDNGDLFLGSTSGGSNIVSDRANAGVSSLRFSDGNGVMSFAQDSFVGPVILHPRGVDGGEALRTYNNRVCVILRAVGVAKDRTSKFSEDGFGDVSEGDVYCFDSKLSNDNKGDKSVNSSYYSQAENIYSNANSISSPILILCNDSSVGDDYLAAIRKTEVTTETAMYIYSLIVDKIKISMCKGKSNLKNDHSNMNIIGVGASYNDSIPNRSSLPVPRWNSSSKHFTLMLSVTFFYAPPYLSFPISTARYRSGMHYDRMVLGTWTTKLPWSHYPTEIATSSGVSREFIRMNRSRKSKNPKAEGSSTEPKVQRPVNSSHDYTHTTAAININVVNTSPVAIYSLLQLMIEGTSQPPGEDYSSIKPSISVPHVWCQISLLLPISFEYFRTYDADYQLGRNEDELRYITLLTPWIGDLGHLKDEGNENMDDKTENNTRNGEEQMTDTVAHVHMRHYIQPLEEYGKNSNGYIEPTVNGDDMVSSSPLWFSPPTYSAISDDGISDVTTDREATDEKKMRLLSIEKEVMYRYVLLPHTSSDHVSSWEPYNITVLYTVHYNLEKGACVGVGATARTTAVLLSSQDNNRSANVSLQFRYPFYSEYKDDAEGESRDTYPSKFPSPPYPINYEVQGCPTTTSSYREGEPPIEETSYKTDSKNQKDLKRNAICHLPKESSSTQSSGDLYSENLRVGIKVEIVNVVHIRCVNRHTTTRHSVVSSPSRPNLTEWNRMDKIKNLPTTDTTLVSIPLRNSSVLKLHLPYIPWDSEGAHSKATGTTTIEAPPLVLLIRRGIDSGVGGRSSSDKSWGTDGKDKSDNCDYSMGLIEGVQFAPIYKRKVNQVTMRNKKSKKAIPREEVSSSAIDDTSKKSTIDTFSIPTNASGRVSSPTSPYIKMRDTNYDTSIYNVHPIRVSSLGGSGIYIPPFPHPQMHLHSVKVAGYNNDKSSNAADTGGYWEVQRIHSSYVTDEEIRRGKVINGLGTENGHYIHRVTGQVVKVGDRVHIGPTGCYQEDEKEETFQKRPIHFPCTRGTCTITDDPQHLDPVHHTLDWVGNTIEGRSPRGMKSDTHNSGHDVVLMHTLNEASEKLHCSSDIKKSPNMNVNNTEHKEENKNIRGSTSSYLMQLYCDHLIPAINRTLSYSQPYEPHHITTHGNDNDIIHHNITFVYIPPRCSSRYNLPRHTVVLLSPLHGPQDHTTGASPPPLYIVREVLYDIPPTPSLHYIRKSALQTHSLLGHLEVPVALPYSATPSLDTVAIADKYLNENGEENERLRFLEDVSNAANDVSRGADALAPQELIRRLIYRRRKHESVESRNGTFRRCTDMSYLQLNCCNEKVRRYELRHIVGSRGDGSTQSLKLGAVVAVPSYNGGYSSQRRIQSGYSPFVVASMGLSGTELFSKDEDGLMTECEVLRSLLAERPQQEAVHSKPPHQLFVELSFSFPFSHLANVTNDKYNSLPLLPERAQDRDIHSFLREIRGTKEPIIVDMEVIDHYNDRSPNPSPLVVLIMRYKLIPNSHIEGSVRPVVVPMYPLTSHINGGTPSSAIDGNSNYTYSSSEHLLPSQKSTISPLSDVVIFHIRDPNGGLSSIPEVLVDVVSNIGKVVMRQGRGSDIFDEGQVLGSSSSVVTRRSKPNIGETSTDSPISPSFVVSHSSDNHYSQAPLSTIVLLPNYPITDHVMKRSTVQSSPTDPVLRGGPNTLNSIHHSSNTGIPSLRCPVVEIANVKFVISDVASIELVRSSAEVLYATVCGTNNVSCDNNGGGKAGVTRTVTLNPQLFTLRSVGQSSSDDINTNICNQMLMNKGFEGSILDNSSMQEQPRNSQRHSVEVAFYANIHLSTLPTLSPTVEDVFGVVKFKYRPEYSVPGLKYPPPLCRFAVQRSIPAYNEDSVQYPTTIVSPAVSPPLLTTNAISDPILVIFQEHVWATQPSSTPYITPHPSVITTNTLGSRAYFTIALVLVILVVGGLLWYCTTLLNWPHPFSTSLRRNSAAESEELTNEDNEKVKLKGNSENDIGKCAMISTDSIEETSRCRPYTGIPSPIIPLVSHREKNDEENIVYNGDKRENNCNLLSASIEEPRCSSNNLKIISQTVFTEMKRMGRKCYNRLPDYEGEEMPEVIGR